MLPAPAHEVLLILILAMTALIVGLFVVLIVQRVVGSVLQGYTRRREATLAPLVIAALDDPARRPDLQRAIRRLDRPVLRESLLRLALDLRGEEGEAIADLFQALGLLQAELAGLRAWRARRRAAAAENLGTLRIRDTLRPLQRILGDRDRSVRIAVVRAIGRIGDGAALDDLVPQLGDPSPGVARQVEEMLLERGQPAVPGILAYLRTAPTRCGQRAAVEALGLLRTPLAADLLLELVQADDPELRIRAVKAAAAIGDPRFLEPFHRLLQDPAWAVRAQAARGLGTLGSPASVAPLRRALADDSWWVRFYAAVALAEHGERGQAALQDAQADPEPVVRDMARYLLERGPMIPALP